MKYKKGKNEQKRLVLVEWKTIMHNVEEYMKMARERKMMSSKARS